MWENTLAKCRCRKTRLRSYAHLVFLVFTEYPFYLFLGKRFFPLLSIKWLFGRNQNSFRKARLRNIFPRQYIASYKHPIRFYLREKKKKHHMDCLVFIKLWHHSLARQLKKGTGTRSWLMFPLVCIVTSSVNFLG